MPHNGMPAFHESLFLFLCPIQVLGVSIAGADGRDALIACIRGSVDTTGDSSSDAKVQGRRHHFGPFLAHFPASLYPHTRAVCDGL